MSRDHEYRSINLPFHLASSISRSSVHCSGILRSSQFAMSCVQYKDFEFYGECECLSNIDIYMYMYRSSSSPNIALDSASYIDYNPFLASHIASILSVSEAPYSV